MNIDHLISAWTGHRAFAHWLVEYLQPQVTVDLGVDTGYSTFCWAWQNPGRVYGIDSFEGDPHAGFRDTWQQVHDDQDRLGLHNIEFIRGRFDQVAATWHQQIDILHIDGLHTRDAVSSDHHHWGAFVSDHGVILFHDTQAFPDVGEFFHSLPGHRAEFLHSAGLGIWTQNSALFQAILDKYSN